MSSSAPCSGADDAESDCATSSLAYEDFMGVGLRMAGGRIAPDAHYIARLKQQLLKCRLNMPAAPVAAPGGGFGAGGRGPPRARGGIQYGRHGHHGHHAQIQGHGHGGHGHGHGGHGRGRDAGRRKHVSGEGGGQSPTIMGLLNKVSPKNIEVIVPKVIAIARSTAVRAVADAVIDQCLRQPTYMSLFIRVLGELSVCGPDTRAVVRDAVDERVRAHLERDILHGLPPAVPQTNYDAFCLRIKFVKTLVAFVAFVVGCVRAHLADRVDIPGYAAFVLAGLERVADPSALETCVDVADVFLRASGSSGKHAHAFRLAVSALKDGFEKRGILTPRARFKLMDILHAAYSTVG